MNTSNSIENGKSISVTVKHLLRTLEVLCIIFVFCPSFLVSCTGQETKVSAMKVVTGIKSHGSSVVDPHPVLIILLIIPVISLVLLIKKSIEEKKDSIIITVCTVIDILIWFIFRTAVKNAAEENYCDFKTTGWFFLNLIVMLLIVLLNGLIITQHFSMEMDLISMFSRGETREVLKQMSDSVSQMSSAVSKIAGNMQMGPAKADVIGYCAKCGQGLEYGLKFCTNCGTPIPESMIEEAKEKKREEEAAIRKAEEERIISEEEKRKADIQQRPVEEIHSTGIDINTEESRCPYCGSSLEADSVYCVICGRKLD